MLPLDPNGWDSGLGRSVDVVHCLLHLGGAHVEKQGGFRIAGAARADRVTSCGPGQLAYDGAVAVAAVVCVALLLNNAVIAPARRLDAFAEQADRLARPGAFCASRGAPCFAWRAAVPPSCPASIEADHRGVRAELPRSPGCPHLEQELGEVPKAPSSLRVDIFRRSRRRRSRRHSFCSSIREALWAARGKVAGGINGCMVEYHVARVRGRVARLPAARPGTCRPSLATGRRPRTCCRTARPGLSMIDRGPLVAGASAGAEMALSVGFSRAASVAGSSTCGGATTAASTARPDTMIPDDKIWCGGATKSRRRRLPIQRCRARSRARTRSFSRCTARSIR